ncbi:nucleotidyltransferase domain-containing protein [Vibrio sp. JC009]|uniref:nucleotidyltransferase domain-containing protein n=1 Tax=Vibrio sp. JC009 TaxID=2912314 RepID=UPI0023B19B0B|nr:nucleotidyltransferase domain-containing protein [Vibrio sp. JC009]WED20689.1 nucleotidyltransferase domain-containing protein [Vibrio sp. JC009]
MSSTLPIIDPRDPFQSAYIPVIKDLIRYLRGGMGSNLHSVYLFGSVARKTAVKGRSNLDVVIVSHNEPDAQFNSLLSTVKWRFKRAYPYVSGLSVQYAPAKEILNLESIFTWGFMLKHCCVCIYGDDLATRFGEFEPSWEIAKYWNMDVEEWLTLYRKKIAQSETPQEQAYHQVVIAKKLLRASYSLIMHKDKRWFDDPVECGQHFLEYHPEKQTEVGRLEILLSGKAIPKRSVIGLLDSYGDWLVKAYKKTEFKIG